MRAQNVTFLIVLGLLVSISAWADAPGRTGSSSEPFLGSPPFQNLICCTDGFECRDGDDTYSGCRMPTTSVGNLKLCGYQAGDEEYPFICDYCPGGTGKDCDGSGWTQVGRGSFQCDGPVYRGNVASVRAMGPNHWYIVGAGVPGDPPYMTAICNDSDDACNEASCYEQGCMDCSSISTSNGLGMCHNEPGAQCHTGELEGTTAELCCSTITGACIRPHAVTGLCAGDPTYDFTYDTKASCAPCPNPDNPADEERCHGWDLGDDWWPMGTDELGSDASLSCNVEDGTGCKVAKYSCDGVLTTTMGIELGNACNSASCDGI